MSESEDIIAGLNKRIDNLVGWNKEMYSNHRIELDRLENQIIELHSIHRIKTDQLGDDNFALEKKVMALEPVYLAGLRMRKTPVVDDDFPEMMSEFDSALEAVETDE